ncbi:MAG: isoleucine--tRNA ligase [Polyangiaceae bacterium]
MSGSPGAPGSFDKVSSSLDFPRDEAKILAFWRENDIFKKSLEKTKNGPSFVFYEGPPTANGMPHNGHVLTRVLKDLFPRYKTMRGYYAPRKAGWDTHGLPVEVEVEKELRIHGKAAIESYGVEPFVRRCIDSVFRYTDEWEKLTERVGFWVDLPTAYVTFHRSYVESVWWALSELFSRGLLYQGHKVVWWWAQGGTALSSAEVGQGYKQVDDPSAYVLFPLKGATGNLEGASLVVWTTTPWTLSSNMYAVVGAKYNYVVAELRGKKVVLAERLYEALSKKLGEEPKVLATLPGQDLVGLSYEPPFSIYASERKGPIHTVVSGDFVTLDTGTGIVHAAPAFGEDDHALHRKMLAKDADLPLFCAVKSDGTFEANMGAYAGRWVKDCDKDILAELKTHSVLLHSEVYRHDYPFCWRADNDPLIQFARPAWYIKTTALIDKAIENNKTINWLPDHIKDGRFGDFLANNVDWALSRERFWGTPLNIWVNDVSGKMEAPASVDAILAKNPKAFDHFVAAKEKDPSLSSDLMVHKPWVDAVTWENPGEPGVYRRVPEVIDCWFDSGCMPFAQWGFPQGGKAAHDVFKASFPADYISEAIDQTRGWFYSLLMVATLLFDEKTAKDFDLPTPSFPRPFKNCIVLGHVSDKEGKKESKSKGNYTPPDVILDAVRMDFAVLAEYGGIKAEPGVALIAREDLEGLDIVEGAKVSLYRSENAGASLDVSVKVGKKLPRRIVLLAESDRKALGVSITNKPDVKPVEVPSLPATERIVLHDKAASAPGADAFRWFFYASNPPWSNTRHSLSNVRATQKETLIKLRNVYSFFTIYANIDGFTPKKTPFEKRSELDRWILGELSSLTTNVTTALDAYDVYGPTQRITDFVESLSNWYVRRSRPRFWKSDSDIDKQSAYDTLYECLVTLAKLLAPFVPFMAEEVHQNLVRKAGAGEVSVHMESWPTADPSHVDAKLSERMGTMRDLVSLGLQARTQAKMRVRQPLRRAHVILSKPELAADLAKYADLIKEELNVLDVEFVPSDKVADYVAYKPKPNFRTLGQRGLGKEAQALKKHMAELDSAAAATLVTEVLSRGKASLLGVELVRDDLELTYETKPDFFAAGDRTGVVVLDTRLDDELRDEGLYREVLSKVQGMRKDAGLDFADRIHLTIHGSERTLRVVKAHEKNLAAEVLATEVRYEAGGTPVKIDDEQLEVGIAKS